MRKLIATSALALSCALVISSPAFADAPKSPRPSAPSSAHPAHAPNAAKKAANDAYAMAVAQAQSSFDRAVADAAAVRDQEMLATPTDKVAVKSARDAYKAAFAQLKQLFQANIAAAKQARDAAIAAAK
jgi:hypothetical protein